VFQDNLEKPFLDFEEETYCAEEERLHFDGSKIIQKM